ncbi:Glycerophosphocholine phosphodiesterase [Physocladia obscura]|uniref:Glycerophosphocholine phosphodiesterase n=1 Tax=Physocladia obscura TaxID=109957 RepID=A0AAD5T8R9_9FUNG|nr:Glycerophosphocholine phosphodiesterase [Physocladia obscura]
MTNHVFVKFNPRYPATAPPPSFNWNSSDDTSARIKSVESVTISLGDQQHVVQFNSTSPEHETSFTAAHLATVHLIFSLSDSFGQVIATATSPPLDSLSARSLCNEPYPLGGRVSLDLISNNAVIGFLLFDVLIVTPLTHPLAKVPAPNPATWPHTRLIGHRGVGMNKVVFAESESSNGIPQVLENTCESFEAARSLGVYAVEFDVQLAKDDVCIIYHDSIVSESAIAHTEVRQLDSVDFLALPTKHSPGKHTTLKIALETLPASLAFNIELKFPILDETQLFALVNVPEYNKYVDAVLRTVLDSPHPDRIVVFSSFNPDVCQLVKLKQTRYPIFFLTMGGTYLTRDVRSNGVLEAAEVARIYGLDGIVTDAAPLVADPSLSKRAKELMGGLEKRVLTYGSANCIAGNARVLRDAGVDALIVDKVAQVRDELHMSQVRKIKRGLNTPPPPYERSDDGASSDSDCGEIEYAELSKSPISVAEDANSATIRKIQRQDSQQRQEHRHTVLPEVKARLARKRSIAVSRRMSLASQVTIVDENGAENNYEDQQQQQLQMHKLETAMLAITETQAKLAEMVLDLKRIAFATTTREQSAAISSPQNVMNKKSAPPSPSPSPSPSQSRSPSPLPSLHRRKASLNLLSTPPSAPSILTRKPSKLSIFVETAANSSGSVYRDPDDDSATTKALVATTAVTTASTSVDLFASATLFPATADSYATPVKLRRPSSLVASPRYPHGFAGVLEAVQESRTQAEEEEAESYDRVKNMLESLLAQASDALNSDVGGEKNSGDGSDAVNAVAEEFEDDSSHDGFDDDDMHDRSGTSYYVNEFKISQSLEFDETWQKEVVLTAEEILRNSSLLSDNRVLDAESEWDSDNVNRSGIKSSNNRNDAIHLVVQFLASVLFGIADPTITSSAAPSRKLITASAPAAVLDYENAVESFLQHQEAIDYGSGASRSERTNDMRPRNRIRRISFDASGNEIEHEMLESVKGLRGEKKGNKQTAIITTAEIISGFDEGLAMGQINILEVVGTVLGLQFTLLYILTTSIWTGIVGKAVPAK